MIETSPSARILGVERPDASGWPLIAGMSLAPLIVGQAIRPWLAPLEERADMSGPDHSR